MRSVPLHRLPEYVADTLAAREIRRALRSGDAWGVAVALLLRLHLWRAGGELPGTAAELEEVTDVPAVELARLLPALLALGEGGTFGFYRTQRGTLRSRELDERLEVERAFRARQAEAGRRSAAARRERFGTAAPVVQIASRPKR